MMGWVMTETTNAYRILMANAFLEKCLSGDMTFEVLSAVTMEILVCSGILHFIV
jgi:hypothetical protein